MPTYPGGATTTSATGGNQTSRTINTPTHVSGDYIYLFVGADQPAITINTPTDFSALIAQTDIPVGGTVRALAALYNKITGGSEPSTYSVTVNTAERFVVAGWAIRDTSGVDVMSTTPNTATSGPATCPSIITTVANCLILRLVATDDDSGVMSATGPTIIAQQQYTSGASVSAWYTIQASAGPTGTQEVTYINSVEEWTAWTIALAPSGGAPPSIFPLPSRRVNTLVRM